MIVTFYSYKGGVGRSMALANVADILARSGLKILMIDFDLEAPGLEQYFQINQAAARRTPGLLDLLVAYKRSMSVVSQGAFDATDFRRIERFITTVYEQLPGGGRLDLMQAGQRDTREQLEQYASTLRGFDWPDFYYNWEGELFFEWLRSTLAAPRYDLVIVDSRTGVTEMGGICTYQLADVVVMLSAANHQNREGTRNVAADFESTSLQLLRRHRSLQILVVPARIEQRDPELLRQFVESFNTEFHAYLPPVLRDAAFTFESLAIPYEPHYAFEERVISDPAYIDTRRSIAGAFERLAKAVGLLAAPAAAIVQRSDAPGVPATADAPPARPQYDATKRFASADFFVSYNARDETLVETLKQALTGFELFVDRHELAAGEDWQQRMETALFHSGAFLLCVGPEGLTPDHVLQATAALRAVTASRDLPIIVAQLPGSADAQLTGLSGPLQTAQVLDLRAGFADAARRVIRASVKLAPTAPAEPAPPTTAAGSPYLGPRAYTEKDAACFTGRESAIEAIVAAIDAAGIAIVAGPSGCGKTSLVQAGVVPALRRREAASPAGGWLVERCSARGDRAADLERALASLGQAADATGAARQLLLFVDDVEAAMHDPDPAAFDAWLRRIVGARMGSSSIRVLFAVREDHAHDLRALVERLGAPPPPIAAIPPLTLAEIRRIVEVAAERVGLAFEPGLVQRIVDDWNDQRFLRLLQTVLEQLWEQRREGFLTNRAYEAIDDPVEQAADAAVASLSPPQQRVVERIVPRLVWLCGDLDLARRIRREDLLLDGITTADLDAALERFIGAGLVYATGDEEGHRLVAPSFTSVQWPRAEAWIDADREFLEWLDGIDGYRRAWEAKRRVAADEAARQDGSAVDRFKRRTLAAAESATPNDLLTGTRLSESVRWLRERAGALTASEREFITASLDQRRLLRRGVLVLAAVALLFLVLGVGSSVLNRFTINEAADVARALDAGENLEEQGQIAQALDLYSSKIASYPERAGLRLRRANLYFQQNRFDDAFADLKVAIEEGDESARGDAYTLRGLVHFRKGESTLALDDLGQAIALKPNDPQALYTRAAIRDQLGQPDQREQALADYNSALKINPDFVDALLGRATLYRKLDRQSSAVSDLTRASTRSGATANQRLAALKELEALGVTATVPEDSLVFIHVASKDDVPTAEKVKAALGRAGVNVESIQVANQATNGDVRYFFKDDETAAGTVRSVVEASLAEQGQGLRLQPLFRPAMSAAVKHGTIEVWIPSLALRLPSKAM